MSAAPAPRYGALRIIAGADGTYRTDPSGELAVILPVADRYSETVDLCAWFPEDPWRWWLFYADMTPILGADVLAAAAYHQEPVNLFSTPKHWLVARGQGAAVLSWDADLRELFEDVPRVDCDCRELRDRLRKTLRRWEPRLAVSRRKVRRAA